MKIKKYSKKNIFRFWTWWEIVRKSYDFWWLTINKVINKVNNRVRFLYRISRFLSPCMKRLACNTIIQPHFNYACLWFCVQLDSRSHIGIRNFQKINWLPISERFNQFLYHVRVLLNILMRFCPLSMHCYVI